MSAPGTATQRIPTIEEVVTGDPDAAGYPFVVVTDRLPLSSNDGSMISRARAQSSLMHAVASRGGAWVAASTGATKASLWLNPLYPQREILAAHREGYCANTLSTVYFGQETTADPPRHHQWAAAHQAVSRQYARHIADLAAPGAMVWIHDHPLQLVPGLLRELRPDLRVGYTLHSPFPAVGALLTVPEHDQILSSMLTADFIGFPDIRSAANFTGYAHMTDHVPPPSMVTPMPVETHTIAELAAGATVQAHAARIRHRLRPATTIMLCVGGDDAGDGSLTVLREYQQLLASGGLNPRTTVLIHLTMPGGAAGNAQDRQDTERLIAQINGAHAVVGHLPVQHQRGPLTPAELSAFFLAADVMLAVPTRDRATHEAAEYVTTRTDGTGRLVLSEFSTAVGQLPAAKPINPHVPGALAEAMCRAASYAKSRSSNMVAMRQQALANNVGNWVETFLRALGDEPSPAGIPAGHLPLPQGQRRPEKSGGGPGNRLAATGSHSQPETKPPSHALPTAASALAAERMATTSARSFQAGMGW